MGPAEIIVVGSYNLDVSLRVPRMPAPGETCLTSGRIESPGGKGSNQAVQAARCGAASAMIAAVGVDAAGGQAMALWAEHGVDAAFVARLSEHPTALAFILVDAAGENQIVVDSGANAHLLPAHVEAAQALFARAALVVGQLEVPSGSTIRAFELARASGAATLLNAAPAPEALDPALLALTDFLIVNEIEGQALSGHDHPMAIGEALMNRVGRAAIITLGAQGAILFERQHPPLALAPPPTSVVDTTGAGDAFTGAFAARWVSTRDTHAALAWGLAAGSVACAGRGAAASYAGADAIARAAAGVSAPRLSAS
jgi:ribokinase